MKKYLSNYSRLNCQKPCCIPFYHASDLIVKLTWFVTFIMKELLHFFTQILQHYILIHLCCIVFVICWRLDCEFGNFVGSKIASTGHSTRYVAATVFWETLAIGWALVPISPGYYFFPFFLKFTLYVSSDCFNMGFIWVRLKFV